MDKAILAAWADPDRKGPSLPFRVRGEAKRADSGGAVLGEGTASPLSTIYGVWGTAVSSRSGVQGAATAAKRFSCVLAAPDHLSWNFLGQVLGEGGGMPPLNPPITSRVGRLPLA